MNRAVVLLSGGMDSLVTSSIAQRECNELYFLHFSYGQRTEKKERSCFKAISNYYNAKDAKIVDYKWLAEIGGSALTDNMIDVDDATSPIPNTYVPFRNATFICAAVAWAEVVSASRIYLGAVEEDSSGYPDCRETFFESMQQVINTGTKKNDIKIQTPVLHLNKSEIVQLGVKISVPFELSWSCYFSEDKACGTCPSCLLRLRAFHEAGIKDPILYRE